MEIRELRVSYEPLRLSQCHDVRADASTPSASVALARGILANEPVEVLGIFCLTIRMRVICYHEVSRGPLDCCPASPKEIFRAAMLTNSASIIVLHNHPSGDPSPSPQDIALTRRLMAAGDLLCLPVVDHIVIGDVRHYSFAEAGLLPRR